MACNLLLLLLLMMMVIFNFGGLLFMVTRSVLFQGTVQILSVWNTKLPGMRLCLK